MMFRKKLLAMLLVFSLFAGVMPMGVLAEDDEPLYEIVLGKGTIEDTTATITVNMNDITGGGSNPVIGSVSGMLFYSTDSDVKNGSDGVYKSFNAVPATIQLEGLSEKKTYYCLAEISYSGSSLTTKDTPFSFQTTATPAPAQPPTVSKPSVSAIGEKTATVSFTITDNGAVITERGVLYVPSSTATDPANYNKSTKATTTSSSVALTTLTANTTYSVCAYVIYNGVTVYSAVSEFTTSSTDPVVETMSVSSITANSATARINVKSAGSSGITERGVIVSTSASKLSDADLSSGATKYKASNANTGETTISLTGLEASTKYYCKAYVISNNKYYFDSSNVNFTTSSNANLPTVSTGSVGEITANSASVSITVSNKGGSDVTERGVVYSSTNSTPTLSDSYKANGKGTGTVTVSITGLSKNTTYYVRTYAKNSYGVSYGVVRTFTTTTSSNANAPSASTSTISSITAYTAEVDINISSSSTVTERGVVYSTSVTDPEVGTSKCYTEKISGTTGSATVMLTGLDKNTKYYVRAYAKSSYGYGYGEVKTFTTESSDTIPEVKTVSASAVSSNGIDVKIDVTSDNGSTITERGVVYSRTSTNPKVNSSSCYTETVSGRTGSTTVTLDNLTPNTTYYVRAYAENRYGTAYGAVKEVKLGDESISTSNVTSITATTAVAGGYVPSDINSSVKERGVAYSTSNRQPTVSDGYFESSRTSSGDFSVNMSGLVSNRTYYVRAYVRTNSGFEYGNAVSFVTKTGNSSLLVLYKTIEGSQVGSQTLTLEPGATFSADRMSMPNGYYPIDPFYTYTMPNSDQSITVTVKLETVYMESSSNYRFEPDKYATRIDVVKMIYALRGMPVSGTIMTFTDIPDNYAYKTALNYVTAKEYMVGDPDGKFRPNDMITRAEIAVICNTVFGFASSESGNPFSDIGGHWGRKYIIGAYNAGAVAGYPNGTFKPNNNITRAELCTLFANAQKRELKPLGTAEFTDVSSTHWAYSYIMNAAVPQP